MERISKVLLGKIWNVAISASGQLLAVETRIEKQKKVLFSIYHLKKEVWLWENVEFEESWWVNLLLVTDNRIYLNYFLEENNPGAKKIIEVDIEGMEVLNEHSEYVVKDENMEHKLPLHYKEGTTNYAEVMQFIKQHNGHEIVKAVDYLQILSVIIISYYLCSNEKMGNFLLILDAEGKELLNERLADGLEHVGMHTFFYVDNRLITIKDTKELVIYKL